MENLQQKQEINKKPEISNVKVNFCQEGNTLGTTIPYEDLEIRLEFQMGEEEGPFIVLKTDGWSFEEISEIEALITRVKKVLN